MNLDLWQAVGGLAVFVGVGVTSGYSAWKSRNADKQTKATGNGFAKDVTNGLDRIEKKIDRTERKIDRHLEAHADAGIRRRGR